MPALSRELGRVAPQLPVSSDDGYILDLPWHAVRLLEEIAAPGWSGLFLAFDYGRTWPQIAEEYPQGTGRAYAAHRQSGDLLAAPGRQDLTCHVCWDWLEEALRGAGFQTVQRESQEAFFVKHAPAAIEAIVRRDPSPLSPARSQLKQLLHPALMGHKFEALWGLRA
jgi:SAM-dependent MidA family methyltransferase